MKLGSFESLALKDVLKKAKGTDLEKVMNEYGLI